MDKAAAQAEAIRLWRALPAKDRMTHHQATAFAALIESGLQFETLGKRAKIVEGWLVREFLRHEKMIETGRQLRSRPAGAAATVPPAAHSARPRPVLVRDKS